VSTRELEAFEAELAAEAGRAVAAVFHNVELTAPRLRNALEVWFRTHLPGATATDYFVHPDAYPVLYLSRWYAASVGSSIDRELFSVITHSCVAACLWVRLVDDVMDEGHSNSRAVLPAVAALHEEAIGPYRAHFRESPDVVAQLGTIWLTAADHTHADAVLLGVDESAFRTVVCAKFSAAMMPVFATASALTNHGKLENWRRFLRAYSVWHQMLNDTLDWTSDLRHGLTTYFLSHAQDAAGTDRVALTRWVLAKGIDWAAAQIDLFWVEVALAARELESPCVDAFLTRRQNRYVAELRSLVRASKALRDLSSGNSGVGSMPSEA
jgi:hypothetical protein